MNEIISVENLIEIKQSEVISTFSDNEKIQALIDLVRSATLIDDIDLTTKKGRDEVCSMAFKVSKMKAGVVKKIISPSIEEHKKIVKSVSSGKKLWEEKMDAWRKEVRQPVDIWEAEQEIIEQKRKDTILAKINDISNIGKMANGYDNESLISKIREVDNIDITNGFDEYAPGALRAKEITKEQLVLARNRLLQKETDEKNRQELAEQKAELDEQQRKIDKAEKEREKEQRIQAKLNKLAIIPSNYIDKNPAEIQSKIDELVSYQLLEVDFGKSTHDANFLMDNVLYKLEKILSQAKQLGEIEEQKQRDEVENISKLVDDALSQDNDFQNEVKTQSIDESQDIPSSPKGSPDDEAVESKPREIQSINIFGGDEYHQATITYKYYIKKNVRFKQGKDINSVLELLELAENGQN